MYNRKWGRGCIIRWMVMAWCYVALTTITGTNIPGPPRYKDCAWMPIIKIRWSHNCLIFIMEIFIPRKKLFILRQGSGALSLIEVTATHLQNMYL